MSLAVSLVICLFLILVTGGITTVAMIQQSETGSNMNSRQAYITAKSGLDTIQDALREHKLTGYQLPLVDGDKKYYVFYYDGAGNLQYEIKPSEGEARDYAKYITEHVPGWTLVGGEGTYFKMENDGGKIKVTALNVTGKYNNNVSLNRGDLSFDAIIMDKYLVKLKSTPTTPTTPPTPTTPTTPSGTTPTTTEPTQPEVDISGLGGRFIMVGQQTALNDVPNDGNGSTLSKTLNSYSKDNNQIFYIPYNENGNSPNAYSYFPIVYDRMVKWTAENDRAALAAYNEGIYFLGDGSGYKNVDEFYARGDWAGEPTFNTVSSITQNDAFNPSLKCKFLCIENNFVSIAPSVGHTPKICYEGPDSCNYVVAYIANDITIFVVDRNKNLLDDFEVKKGYYKITSGSAIGIEATWSNQLEVGSAEEATWKAFNLYDTIISYYNNSGEIHSACNETELHGQNVNNSGRVQITDNNGKINTYGGTETGYSSSQDEGSYGYSTIRDNQNIFLSPNFPVTAGGYYHWYSGRSFNFQWFRTNDFTVVNDAHIVMSSSNIVLTIGPTVKTNTGTVTVSNVVAQDPNQANGTATWKLYGDKGKNAPQKLNVMCGFVVKYGGTYRDTAGNIQYKKSYAVQQGSYVNVPAGLNLFSDEGMKYFLYTSDIRSLSDVNVVIKSPKPAPVSISSSRATSDAVMPASINAQTTKVANLLSKLTNGFRFTPMTVQTVTPDGTGKAVISAFSDNVVEVQEDVTSLIFNDGANDGVQKIHVGSKVTIMRVIDGVAYEYMVFDANTGTGNDFIIPDVGTTELDLLNPDGADMLIDRALLTAQGANYEVIPTLEDVQILEKYY